MAVDLSKIPPAVWVFIAVVILVLAIAWLGYDHWADIKPIGESQ
jgi:hypothetical protein